MLVGVSHFDIHKNDDRVCNKPMRHLPLQACGQILCFYPHGEDIGDEANQWSQWPDHHENGQIAVLGENFEVLGHQFEVKHGAEWIS